MKKKRIKSAIPIYASAAVWLLLGLICPRMLLKGWFLLLAAVLSAAAYFLLGRVFPGREVEVREAANSGDKTIDALIEEGFVREIVSKVQTMCKEAGFEVTDHIVLSHHGNSLIESIFAKHGAEIAADTLADSIKLGSAGYVKDWEINGESVTLGVEKS